MILHFATKLTFYGNFLLSSALKSSYLMCFRCHPFLNRRAKYLLNEMCRIACCKNRIHNTNSDEEKPRNGVEYADAIRTIDGRILVTNSERQVHFELLNQFWNSPKIE